MSRKAQYEKKFREWGFQKNRSKDDWKIVGQKVVQRKRTAKESNVYVDGELMPRKRLQKEISRQGFMTVTEQFHRAQGELPTVSHGRPRLTALRSTSGDAPWIRHTHANRSTGLQISL
jgi:hypothetical protein